MCTEHRCLSYKLKYTYPKNCNLTEIFTLCMKVRYFKKNQSSLSVHYLKLIPLMECFQTVLLVDHDILFTTVLIYKLFSFQKTVKLYGRFYRTHTFEIFWYL
jgi:hypothetical protein